MVQYGKAVRHKFKAARVHMRRGSSNKTVCGLYWDAMESTVEPVVVLPGLGPAFAFGLQKCGRCFNRRVG
jgi:hypothetical protein